MFDFTSSGKESFRKTALTPCLPHAGHDEPAINVAAHAAHKKSPQERTDPPSFEFCARARKHFPQNIAKFKEDMEES